MAASFSLNSKAYEGRYLHLSCVQVPNVEKNTSTISWTLQVLGGSAPCYSTGPTTVVIGTQQVCAYPRKSYTTSEFPAAAGSVSGVITVSHNDDGSCTLPVRLTTAIYTTASSTVSGIWTLDTIARASTVGATDAYIGGVSTVTVVQKSTLFTHTLHYQFGTLQGYLTAAGTIQQQPVQLSATGIPFALPQSFYAQIPNAASGKCTVKCTTYFGGVQIGTPQSCSFTVFTDASVCGPVVTGTVCAGDPLTVTLTGDENTLVRYVSTAACTVSTQLRCDAGSLKAQTIGGVAAQDGARQIPAVFSSEQTYTVDFSATDSRGHTGTAQLSVPLIPYVQLTNNASVNRTDPTSGNALLTLQGNCFRGSFGKVSNALTVTYQLPGASPVTVQPEVTQAHTYFLQIPLTGLDYTKSFVLTVCATDCAMTAEKTLTVQKGLPVFDWGEEDFCFHVPVELPALRINGEGIEDVIRRIIQGG